MFDGYLVDLLLCLVIACVRLGDCWVFTDVDYAKIMERSNSVDDNDTNLFRELSDEDLKELKLSLIYPGTKWCGAGNIAEGDDDLGPSKEADMCCREHDMCPDIIPAGEVKYNLTNEAFYSRLSCKCDERFHKCLHAANTTTSNRIGTIYFNALGTQCFKKDFPITGCVRYGGWLNRKCLEYTYDTNGEQRYQWFYVPNY